MAASGDAVSIVPGGREESTQHPGSGRYGVDRSRGPGGIDTAPRFRTMRCRSFPDPRRADGAWARQEQAPPRQVPFAN